MFYQIKRTALLEFIPLIDVSISIGQFQLFLPLLSSSAGEIHVQSDLNLDIDLGNLILFISLPL